MVRCERAGIMLHCVHSTKHSPESVTAEAVVLSLNNSLPPSWSSRELNSAIKPPSSPAESKAACPLQRGVQALPDAFARPRPREGPAPCRLGRAGVPGP